MAIVYGEIESLKTLLKELKQRNINNFNSINEIELFLKQYKKEKIKILERIKLEINHEVITRRKRVKDNKTEIEASIEKLTNDLNERIDKYHKKIEDLRIKSSIGLFKIINNLRIYVLSKRLDYINYKFNENIRKTTERIEKKILKDKSVIENIFKNKEKELARRSKQELERLSYIYKTLKDLYPLFSGAIGEKLVVEEVKKLTDDYILINDFKLKFEKPIRYKRNNDRIYSVQIDHLLISPAGIFIIETKNWSQESINKSDLRSPVEQIQRAGYAMYTFLKDMSYKFRNVGKHHWGKSRIPTKNVIVMINHKPNNYFEFVKVLKLNELLGYVSRFDKLYSENEVHVIAKELLKTNRA
jgi:hypothetical protein